MIELENAAATLAAAYLKLYPSTWGTPDKAAEIYFDFLYALGVERGKRNSNGSRKVKK
jgi:hypothetical protein